MLNILFFNLSEALFYLICIRAKQKSLDAPDTMATAHFWGGGRVLGLGGGGLGSDIWLILPVPHYHSVFYPRGTQHNEVCDKLLMSCPTSFCFGQVLYFFASELNNS